MVEVTKATTFRQGMRPGERAGGTYGPRVERTGRVGEIYMESGTITFSTTIIITNGVNVRIRDNQFSNQHVDLTGCTDTIIEGNEFVDLTSDGVNLKSCTRARVEKNSFRNGGHSGIVLGISASGLRNTNIQVLDNSLDGMQTTLVAGRGSIQVRGNVDSGTNKNDTNVLVADNKITNRGIVGIGLDGVEDCVISNNKIYGRTTGEGIAFNGKNIAVLKNVVRQEVAGGACCLIWGDDEANGYSSDNYRILYNYFEQGVSTANQCIAVVPNAADQVIDNIRVHGNILRRANFGLQAYNSGGSGTFGVDNLFFTGNWIEPDSSDSDIASAFTVSNTTLTPNP